MALFKTSELRDYTIKKSIFDAEKVLIKEAAYFDEGGYDIFLSHSYKDADMIFSIKDIIEDMGFSVYVDWITDPHMDRSNVTADTAEVIRRRIVSCRCLVYVPSENSLESKWMPWELGYADGAKDGMVAILPISKSSYSTNAYKGREYLGLYYYITEDIINGTKTRTLWTRKDATSYVIFEDWLKGKLPRMR